MIQINKSANVPGILTSKGKQKIKELCDAFDSNPEGYSKPYHKTNNPFKFEFDGDVYGPEEVKKQLIKEQFNKCCYCENKDFTDIAYGDVEHFRPKSAFKRDEKDKGFLRPGYYWMAYEWENLYFSCQVCNQGFKRNFFPLSDETKRAKSHKDKLESLADTLLVDPGKEDPEIHIGFRKEVAYEKTPKGKASINYFGIYREELEGKRRKHLEEVKANVFLSKLNIATIPADIKDEVKATLGAVTDQDLLNIINTAKNYVAMAAKNEAAFALMVRSNYPALPR